MGDGDLGYGLEDFACWAETGDGCVKMEVRGTGRSYYTYAPSMLMYDVLDLEIGTRDAVRPNQIIWYMYFYRIWTSNDPPPRISL